MSKQSRVLTDDNGRLAFTGEPGTMRRDEAMQFVTSQDTRRILSEVKQELAAFLDNELYFRGEITQVIVNVAKGIMGPDRPNGDDDAEYYAFCESLFNRVKRRIITSTWPE
jgi:hypothetical protein